MNEWDHGTMNPRGRKTRGVGVLAAVALLLIGPNTAWAQAVPNALFGPAEVTTLPGTGLLGPPFQGEAPSFVDVDGDGVRDVVSAAVPVTGSWGLVSLRRQGTAVVGPTFSPVGSLWAFSDSFDFNADGNLDLAAWGNSGGSAVGTLFATEWVDSRLVPCFRSRGVSHLRTWMVMVARTSWLMISLDSATRSIAKPQGPGQCRRRFRIHRTAV